MAAEYSRRETLDRRTPPVLPENAAIEGLVVRYAEERPIDDATSRPAGSVPVDFTITAVPVSRTPQGG